MVNARPRQPFSHRHRQHQKHPAHRQRYRRLKSVPVRLLTIIQI